MQKYFKLLLILMVALLSGCGGTGAQLSVLNAMGSNPSKDRQLNNTTLREKIANIGSVKYLYASFPVEFINFEGNQTAIEADGQWLGFINAELFNICDSANGKRVTDKVITDSFTGKQTVQKVEPDTKSKNWQCYGGSMDFNVETIVAKRPKQLNQKMVVDVRYLMLLTSSKAGAPILSNFQYNMMNKFENSGKPNTLEEFLNTKFGIVDGKATTHVRHLADGSMYQKYKYEIENVTDIDEDLGVLYDLNAYCTYKGGNLNPVKGYTVKDIEASLFPKDAVFQCMSSSEPFYAKIKHIFGTSSYELFIRNGIIADLPISKEAVNDVAPEEQTAQSSADINSTMAEMLKQKFASQMSGSSLSGAGLLQVVNQSVPHAVMDAPEKSLDIYWVKANGACENLAIVSTAKLSKDITSIENYIRCNGQVKQTQNTPLPVTIPDSLKSKEADFIRQIKSSGSVVYYDTMTGITAIGRKDKDSCQATLFYIKDNSLLYVTTIGC